MSFKLTGMLQIRAFVSLNVDGYSADWFHGKHCFGIHIVQEENSYLVGVILHSYQIEHIPSVFEAFDNVLVNQICSKIKNSRRSFFCLPIIAIDLTFRKIIQHENPSWNGVNALVACQNKEISSLERVQEILCRFVGSILIGKSNLGPPSKVTILGQTNLARRHIAKLFHVQNQLKTTRFRSNVVDPH